MINARQTPGRLAAWSAKYVTDSVFRRVLILKGFPHLALTLTLALSSSMGPPMMVVSLDQARCRFWTPGSARIIREVGRRIVIPRFQDW